MFRLPSRRCITVAVTIAFSLVSPISAIGQEIDIQEFAATHRTEILNLASDEEAVSWFLVKLGPRFKLKNCHPRESSTKTKASPVPQDMTNEISQFMANITVSHIALDIQKSLQAQRFQAREHSWGSENYQVEWVLTKHIPKDFPRMIAFANSLNHFLTPVSSDSTIPPEYTKMSQFLDETYSTFLGSEDSWVVLLEENGIEGIYKRIGTYWETPGVNQASGPVLLFSESDKMVFANHYAQTRLIPVFLAHLLAESIRVEAQADAYAQKSFTRLTKLKAIRQGEKAYARLCGKWQWTVHNHQNHQDHRMIMSFSSPTDQTRGQPQPSKIVINGNTVYLRWDFPAGMQEDSLLLSNGDKRLEGTFINSGGPNGSIMGKRLTSCPP